MFLLKKIISSLLLPPGCFIAILVCGGFWFIFRKQRLCGIFAIAVGMLLWGASIAPVAQYLMRGLESELTIPRDLHGDVIILLGGGANDDTRDLTGNGAPSDEMMSRLVTAFRVQKRTGLPIIVSGGAFQETETPEAWIAQRFLKDLGVPPGMILIEDKSMDTGENGRLVAEMCARKGFPEPSPGNLCLSHEAITPDLSAQSVHGDSTSGGFSLRGAYRIHSLYAAAGSFASGRYHRRPSRIPWAGVLSFDPAGSRFTDRDSSQRIDTVINLGSFFHGDGAELCGDR